MGPSTLSSWALLTARALTARGLQAPTNCLYVPGCPPERTILTRATRWRLCSGYGRCQPIAVKILASGSMLRSSGTRPPSMQSATPHSRDGQFPKSVRGSHGRGEATPRCPPVGVRLVLDQCGLSRAQCGLMYICQTSLPTTLNLARVRALKLSLRLHPLRLL
jgi:hypothetical protein